MLCVVRLVGRLSPRSNRPIGEMIELISWGAFVICEIRLKHSLLRTTNGKHSCKQIDYGNLFVY